MISASPDGISRSQLDALGIRLRDGIESEADLEVLNRYRNGFDRATQSLRELVVPNLPAGTTLTARPMKTTFSIVAKLRRESIRLSQMQDIGGLRALVPDRFVQDEAWRKLQPLLRNVKAYDRRATPSNAYRAVHLVASFEDRPIEIQLRTHLQEAWAHLTEALAVRYGIEVKYGAGPQSIVNDLVALSDEIHAHELLEYALHYGERGHALLEVDGAVAREDLQTLIVTNEQLAEAIAANRARLDHSISDLSTIDLRHMS